MIRVKVLRGKGIQQATSGAAAFDLCWNPKEGESKTFYLAPGEVYLASTGIAISMEQGKCGLILPRSGLSTNIGLCVRNSPGLIDSDYRGEILVALENRSRYEIKDPQIMPGNRIAQLMIVDCYSDMMIVDELDDTDRGAGGFGSTGMAT